MEGQLCREVLGTLLAAILVLLATQHTQAIRWLGLHSAGPALWNSTAGCREARQEQQLTRQQARLCRTSPDTMAQVVRAASVTASVCKLLLQDRRWNCSSVQHAPRFTPDLTSGTREQAFVYALSSAALTHAVARACAAGQLFHCACASPPHDPPDGHFKWGGCGDNVRWATHFTRQFLDSAERRHGRRYRERMRMADNDTGVAGKGQQQRLVISLVNLHNNRAGRRVVERSVQSQCKCHGVSGSCSVRTCWRALPTGLKEVGARLLRQYPRAVQVRVNPVGLGRSLLSARPGPLYTQDDLLYLSQSPDYCHRDYRVGSVGTYGRKCNSTAVGYASCDSMCCGRGYVTRTEERVERCHCKYYWCCYVKCKTCRSWVQVDQCS